MRAIPAPRGVGYVMALMVGTAMVSGPAAGQRRGDPGSPATGGEIDSLASGEADTLSATVASDSIAAAATPDSITAATAPDTVATAAADTVATQTTPSPPAPVSTDIFNPVYTSSFRINRSLQTWKQTWNVSLSRPGGAKVENNTTISIGKDDALGRDTRDRNTTTTVTLPLSRHVRDSLSLHTELVVGRKITIDRGQTDSRSDVDRFAGRLAYRRLLGEGLTSTLGLDFGTASSETVDPRTSTERIARGPYAQTTATLGLDTGGMNGTFTARLKSERLDSQEAITGTSTDDDNYDADIGLSFDVDAPGLESMRVTLDRQLARREQPLLLSARPDSLVAEQDRARQLTNRVTVDATAAPAERLHLNANVSWQDVDLNRELDRERSQQTIDRNLKTELKYEFPDSTRLNLKYDQIVLRSLYDADTRRFLNGRIETNSLAGSVSRHLGSRTRIDAGGTYLVQSYLYDDTVANTSDRDVVRGDFDASARYDPHPDVDTELRFTVKHVQTIHVFGDRSAGNTTQQTFSIRPKVVYHLTPALTFTEDAAVIAIAKVFDFDEDRNQLSRSTELRSTVDYAPHRTVALDMIYVYRIVLDGSFRRGADGIRRFGKSSDALTRDLRVNLSLRPIPTGTLSFKYNRRFGDTISFRRQGAATLETLLLSEYTEFRVGANLSSLTLDIGPTLRGNIERVETWTGSTRREHYWNGEVSVTQRF